MEGIDRNDKFVLTRGDIAAVPASAPLGEARDGITVPAGWLRFEKGSLSIDQVLRNLETHPHVQRMALDIDYHNAWEVGYTLIQLLPLEEALKYELLGADTLDEMLRELDILLNQISGEG